MTGLEANAKGPAALSAAVGNMLVACGQAAPGDRVLVVREPPGLGYYADDLASAVVGTAQALGFAAAEVETPFQPEARGLPGAMRERMAEAGLTVFLARIGDQLRFRDMPEGTRSVVCYALDVDALAGPFGTAPHGGFVALKAALEAAIGGAEITITCRAGTVVTGFAPPAGPAGDVSVRRFPMLVPAPVPAEGFAGRVALSGFLAGTGSRYYRPFAATFRGPVVATFERGRLTGFEGAEEDVTAAHAHYDRVSRRYGIDRDVVHSWHAGMHPACAFAGRAGDGYERWSGSAFGNPRLLHFHTCGAYAPGEICWNVVDPTVTANGVAIWRDGRLDPAAVPGGAAILARHPEIAALFADPRREIGL